MSLENLLPAVNRFDELMLVCAAANYGVISAPALLLTLKEHNIVYRSEDIPNWANPIIEQVMRYPWEIQPGDDLQTAPER